jgi:hypothetical protein
MVTASRARRAARSGVVAIILFLAAVAAGASAQTSAPLPVGAEALTADNAVLLTVFLEHDQSRPLILLRHKLRRGWMRRQQGHLGRA